MSTVTRSQLSKNNPYYISKHRYYELKHFCLQYPEWKKSYISVSVMSGSSIHDTRRSESHMSNPTEDSVIVRLYFRDRMELVENAAKESCGDLWNYMLQAVTDGLSYERVLPPCCKEVWYAGYRRFFWVLDKMRK